MARYEAIAYADSLDVLRRLVPTPLKAVYRIGSLRVVVETNDFSLLPHIPLDAQPLDSSCESFAWKLVRDPDARGPLLSPRVLISDSLTVVEMGAPCLVGVDRSRRELLGFLGADVDVRTYEEKLLPYLFRLAEDAASVAASKPLSAQSVNPHA